VLVRWFHEVLGHPGIHRLNDSIEIHFYHPCLRATVDDVIKHCEACQINNLPDQDMDNYCQEKQLHYHFKKLQWILSVYGELLYLKKPMNCMPLHALI
jgi:hypothetical protein